MRLRQDGGSADILSRTRRSIFFFGEPPASPAARELRSAAPSGPPKLPLPAPPFAPTATRRSVMLPDGVCWRLPPGYLPALLRRYDCWWRPNDDAERLSPADREAPVRSDSSLGTASQRSKCSNLRGTSLNKSYRIWEDARWTV